MLESVRGIAEFKDSNGGIISISVTNQSDSLAAGVANAYLDAFISYYRDEQVEDLKRELAFTDSRLAEIEAEVRSMEDSLFAQELEFVDRRTAELQGEMESAEDALYNFKRQHQILPDDSIELEKLSRRLSRLQLLVDQRTALHTNLLSQREQIRLKHAHLKLPGVGAVQEFVVAAAIAQ